MRNDYQLIIVGGGPAGLAAACSAKENGLESVLILERETALGGILRQCIHTGFGLKLFQEELTGPEYARRFTEKARELGVEYKTSTTVLSIEKDKTVVAISDTDGFMRLKAQAVVAAMGCREKPRGALPITGTRPAGIRSAGTAQKMINMGGLNVGEKIVILGSGDLGMIMARRFTLEGKSVLAVVEQMPQIGGLLRNKVHCLDDFEIPLFLSHTVTEVYGKHRVEAVMLCPVDKSFKPIRKEKKIIPCDTLITAVGLIPEAELLRDLGLSIDIKVGSIAVSEKYQSELPWLFACGNLLYAHDLVDDVTVESAKAGKAAAEFVLNVKNREPISIDFRKSTHKSSINASTGTNAITRMKANELLCLLCPNGCVLRVNCSESEYKIENNACERGEEYAASQLNSPVHHITSTVPINGNPFTRLPVRTSRPIAREKTKQVMREIHALEISAPITFHQVLIHNVAGCDSDVISSAQIDH